MLESPRNNPVTCPANEFKGKMNFWIDPSGIAYIVGDFGHCAWAAEYMDCHCIDELEDLGWVHYSYHKAWCWPTRLTKKQTSVLLDICIANSLKYSDIVASVAQFRREVNV